MVTSTARTASVFLSSYRNMVLNQSVHVCFGLFSNFGFCFDDIDYNNQRQHFVCDFVQLGLFDMLHEHLNFFMCKDIAESGVLHIGNTMHIECL